MRYMVTFEFLNGEGEWIRDNLSNNGEGMALPEARAVATQIRHNSIVARNIEVKEVIR